MPLSFLPTVVVDDLIQLTPELLQALDVKLLMLDFDNTIVPYTTDIPTPSMEKWLREMTSTQITVCVVSNSRSSRVQNFCEKYGIHCIIRAK